MPAQRLAQTRPGAAGALLLEACAPASAFGERWPADVPVQVHGMERDPFFGLEGDVDAARELVAQADDGELFVYPGDVHLFTDSSLPSLRRGGHRARRRAGTGLPGPPLTPGRLPDAVGRVPLLLPPRLPTGPCTDRPTYQVVADAG